MDKRKGIIISIIGIFIVLLGLIGLTYAFFMTRVTGNPNDTSIDVELADLELLYIDGSPNVSAPNMMPSDTIYTKEFKVKNEGNTNVEYGAYLIDVVNTFERKDDIKYTLTCSTDGDLPCSGVASETTFPSGIAQLVLNTIEPNKTHTYTLSFTYRDTNTNQSVDMGKTLMAKIQIFAETNGNIIPFENNTLAFNIVNTAANRNVENKSVFTPNLSATNMVKTVTSDERVLSTAQDDYGTSYYFRGNSIDNYVEYADMCWRIVRIEGDGSLKLALASESSCTAEGSLTDTSAFATDGSSNLLAKCFGYKTVNGITIADYNNSEAGYACVKNNINSWLTRTIDTTDLTNLKNETYCIGDMYNAYDYNNSGSIVGTVSDKLTAKESFRYSTGNRFNATFTPTYVCDATGSGNEINNNKVGLLTMDEVVYAGGGNVANTNYYLNQNAKGEWWLINSSYFETDSDTGFHVGTDGIINNFRKVNGGSKIRPTITLNFGAKYVDGTGFANDPYIISYE